MEWSGSRIDSSRVSRNKGRIVGCGRGGASVEAPGTRIQHRFGGQFCCILGVATAIDKANPYVVAGTAAMVAILPLDLMLRLKFLESSGPPKT